jgi:hypothetical protein
MKNWSRREYSRRDLERAGEPLGECVTMPKVGGGYICGGGGKGSTPAAPDYRGAAEEQAASSKEVTNMQTYANRPTQNTPWGTVSWETGSTTDPSTGQAVTTWTQNYNLTPEARQALNAQLETQNQRSQLANSFMDRVEGEYSRPFDWNSMPARGGNVGGSAFQTLGAAPQLTTSMSAGPSAQQVGAAPTLNGNVSTESSQRMGGAPSLINSIGSRPSYQTLSDAPQLRSNLNTQAIQNRVNLRDNGALQGADGAERQRIENALFERMAPTHQRQQSALDVKLANQGITAGSEAYKRAVQSLGDQQSRERFDALNTAGNEMSRMAQIALGNRQQLTNEDIAQANLFNSANNQLFNQDLQSGQFRNQALQNQLAMQQSVAGFNNAVSQQQMQDEIARGNFANAAQQNQFNMGLQGMNANNAAINQDFSQRMAANQAQNQALQNQYNMGLQGAQLNNAALQQDYNQRLGAFQFGNTALQNQQALNQNTAAFNNQAGQNQFAQMMQQSQYQNQLRQAAIAEEMQRRGMSLNEMNALLTGQQVGMQQMPNFNAAQAAQPTQYLNAANMQYQANLDQANMNNANQNSFMNGLFSLGGAAAQGAMMFSDSRLKKIISKVGEKNGIGWYLFKYLGSNAMYEGAIAQEVQKVKPEAVKQHANGFLMVDYAALEA